MGWLKFLKTATKPAKVAPSGAASSAKSSRSPRPIGERILVKGSRGTPIFKEDWDAFATPYRDAAREYIKQAKAFARTKETKITQQQLVEARQLLGQCQQWLKRFEAEFDTFYIDTAAADARATALYDLAFEAEGELEDAVRHLQDAIDWRGDPENPDNYA